MSTSIEQQVVQMKFDNKQFESGVAQSMSTLEKFEQKLNFKGAAKSFEDISKAADRVSLENLTKQADGAGAKFDALAVIAISALNRITNEAISAGTKLVKSLSIDQVASGWSKYEARTAAVQTLVNATGRSVEQIEKYMDKLMLYSDETSYGFQDMTSALATMVSAGGDINKLVPLLEGFGNAVSFVGKGASEYSRAIIQLSQGYGRNALMLEDWKSVEQTLGGAKQLKQVFIEVGEELGKIEKGELTIGTFNESLRDKWLDQKVMEVALGRFAEMTEKAFEMIEAGEAENVADAYAILSESVDDYRIKAAKAAQEAKSFTEAIDATKDAVSTKWMESFQIIFGNYEEATKLWTELTNTLWDLFAASGDTRNEILNVWRSFEGRDAMIDAAKAAFEALYTPVQTVGEAIHEIFFPGSTTEKGLWLVSATEAVRDFFQALILSEEATTNLKKGFKLLLIPVYAFYQILRVGTTVIAQLIITLFALGNALLTLPSRLLNVENPLKRIFGEERYGRIVSALTVIINKLGDAFIAVGSAVSTIGRSIASAFSSRLSESIARLFEFLAPIAGWILDRIVDGFEYLASFDYSRIVDWASGAIDSLVIGFNMIINWCAKGISAVKDFFSRFFVMSPVEILQSIINTVKTMKDNLLEFAKSLGFDRLLSSLSEAGGNVIQIVTKLGQAIAEFVGELTPAKIIIIAFGVSLIWVFTSLAKAISTFGGIAGSVVGLIDSIRGTFEAFQQKLKGSPILQVAFAIGVLAVSLGALSQLNSNDLNNATKALGGLMIVLGILVGGAAVISKFLLTTNTMGRNLVKVTSAILAMTTSVAVLTAALFVLTQINLEGIVNKIGALAAMIVVLGVAVWGLNKILKDDTSIANSLFIVAFALSLNMMVKALEKINASSLALSVENVVTIGVIVALMLALGASAQRLKLTSGISMILFAGTLLIFAQAIKPIANIDVSRVLAALTNMILIFVPLAIISKLVKATDISIGLNIAALAAGMLVMYAAIRAIGNLDIATVAKGTLAIGAILVFVGLMNVISKIGTGFGLMKLEGSFLSLSAAVLVLGIAINYIGGLDASRVSIGTRAVSILLILLTFLAKAMGETEKATASVIAMSICIGLLTAAVGLLSLMDPVELYTTIGALTIAFGALSVLFKTIQGLNEKNAIGVILSLVGVFGGIALLFDYLENTVYLGDEGILKKAGAIGIVLVALGASLALIGQNKSLETASLKRVGNTLATLGGLLVSSAVVFGVFATLTQDLDPIDMLGKATALGIVMLALGESMSLFNIKTAKKENMNQMLKLLAVMGIVAGAITAILAIPLLSDDGIIFKALAFSLVLTTMTGAVAALSVLSQQLKTIDKNVIGSLTILSVAVGVIGLVAVGFMALINLIPDDTGTLMSKVIGFSAVLLSLIGCIAILSSVSLSLSALGKVGGWAILGTVIATGIIAALGALIYFVGSALSKDIDSADRALTAAEMIIPRIAMVIGQTLGELVGGVALGLIDSIGMALESLGTHLSNFAVNVAGFTQINIPSTFPQAIANLCLALLAITATEFINNILSFVTGGTAGTLITFGTQLLLFAPYFVSFGEMIKDIPQEAMLAAAAGLDSLANILSNIPIEGGLMGAIFGNKSLDDFGKGLSKIAKGVGKYATTLKDTDVDDDTIAKTNKLTQTLVDLANKLPRTGGLQSIFGETNFKTFGEQIVSYGGSLKTYIGVCNEIKEIYDRTAFTNAQSATDAMIKLAKSVPESGVLTTFFGAQDIGVFGTQLQQFGSGLAGFFRALSPYGVYDNGKIVGGVQIDEKVTNAAVKAGETLRDLAKTVPSSGGFISFITGQSDLGKFGTQVGKFGNGIAEFFKEVSGSGMNEAAIALAEKAGTGFVNIANSIDSENVKAGLLGSNFELFSGAVKKLGTGMKDFYGEINKITNWDSVNTAVRNLTEITNMGTTMKNLNATTAANFNTFLTNVASSGVSNFISTMSTSTDKISESIHTTISSALTKARQVLARTPTDNYSIIDSILAGIEGKNNNVSDRAKSVAELAITAIETEGAKLEIVGQGMIEALITGFDDTEKTDTAFTKVTNKIIATVNKILDIGADGSKVFKQIAEYCILGFVNGVDANIPKATTAIHTLASNAINEFQTTLGIASPSKKFAEIGMYAMLGFSKGISDNSSGVLKSMVKMGENLLDSIKEFLGIRSPSKIMRDEVGRYIIQGIAEGITEDMSAEEAAAQKAQNIMNAFQSELNKWSAEINLADLEYKLWSTVNRGASEFETREQDLLLLEKKLTAQAERYNAAKAQYEAVSTTGDEDAIRDAKSALMQEEITMRELTNELADLKNSIVSMNWSLDINTIDLESKLWETINRNATASESREQEINALDKKLNYQAKLVNAAQSEYQRALETYGETSDVTQEAYNTYIEAQTTLWDLANTLSDLLSGRNDGIDWGAERMKATDEFDRLFGKIDELVEKGIIEREEGWQYAYEKSGLKAVMEHIYGSKEDIDPADLIGQAFENIDGIVKIENPINPEDLFEEYVSNASGSIGNIAGNVEFILKDVSPKSSKGITDTGGISSLDNYDPTGVAEELQKELSDVMENLGLDNIGNMFSGGFIDGLRNNIGNIGDTFVDIAKYGFNAMRDFFGIGDGSSSSAINPLKDLGSSIMNFFGIGIEESTDVPVEAAESAAAAVFTTVEHIPEDWYGIGNQATRGMANGMIAGIPAVSNAASMVADAAFNASTNTLEIHSPSRKYYYIGEMINQGLANGLLDSTSVVKNAVGEVLSNAQTVSMDYPLSAPITPVIDDTMTSTQSRQALRYNAAGALEPEGYRDDDKAEWWTSTAQEVTDAIYRLGEAEERRRADEAIAMAQYQAALEELRGTVRTMADKPAAVNLTQNNYSPKALDNSTIYRNTKTALAKASAAASPTGTTPGANN